MPPANATLTIALASRRGSNREVAFLNRGPELPVWLLAAGLAWCRLGRSLGNRQGAGGRGRAGRQSCAARA